MMICKEMPETLYFTHFPDESGVWGEVPTVLALGRAPTFDAPVSKVQGSFILHQRRSIKFNLW